MSSPAPNRDILDELHKLHPAAPFVVRHTHSTQHTTHIFSSHANNTRPILLCLCKKLARCKTRWPN
jgi:hypothetical protein